MYEEADDVAQQKYLKAQESIDDLFHKLSELWVFAAINIRTEMSWEEVKENIVKLQLTLTTLEETRKQLISVNVQVHRFMTDYGSDVNYKNCSLKENITELYQKLDDIYELSGEKLTELQELDNNWAFEEQIQSVFKKGEKTVAATSSQPCDKDSLRLKDASRELLQKDLNLLRSEADTDDADSWKDFKLDLQDPHKQTHTDLASRSADPLSSTDEDDPDDHFEDAIQLLDHPSKTTPKWTKLWRILRVAIPVQVTLVLLFCLACYLEPNCCDRINNFTLSLTPHLRYPKGPPPV